MSTPPKTEDTNSSKEVLQEERYLWMARAFALVALLAVIANVLMLIALSGLTPLIRVQPFYLQSRTKEEQVISVVPPDFTTMNEKDFDVLQESLVREYLLARFGISSDVEEVEQRWGIDGIVAAMSETSVYRAFNELESTVLLNQARTDGLTQDVKIGVVNRKTRKPDVWEAEIEVIKMSQRVGERDITKWKIKMEVVFQPLRQMQWAQRLKNPLGFTVTHFSRTPLDENKGIK